MRKINIREALLRLDKRTDCQYDLTTLYEACDLDEKDKKKLVQYIDGYEDPASIGKFLETRCDAVCESIDDDDVSDMKLVDDINNDDDHALWELMNKFEEEDLQLKELTEDVDTGDEYEDYTSDEYCPSCGTLCDYAYDTTDNGSWVRFNCPDCGNSFDRTKVKKHTSESLTEDVDTSMLHAINLAAERNERFKFDLQSFLMLNNANSIDELSEEQLTTFYNGIKSIISKTKDNVPEDVLSAFDLTSTDALSEGARPLSKNDIIYRYNFGLPLSDKDIEKIGTVEEHQQNSRNVSEIIKGIKKIIPNCSISKKRDWTSLSLMLRTIEPITKDQQTECKEFLKQFPYPSNIYGADTYLRANGFISLSPIVDDLSESLTEDITPDEKVAIARRIRKVATGVLVGKLGYEEDFVDDYMIIDVDDVADNTCIKVEVRAEVDYDGLMTLGQALDPIVKEYDKNAYFEPVTSGIMSAYIRKDQSEDIPDEAAVKEWTDRFNACQTKDDVIAVYRDLIKVKDNNEVTWGTIEALYDVIDAKMDSLGESLTEATNNSNFDLINHLKQALKGRGRLTVNDTGVRFVSLEDDFATFVSRDAFDRWLQQCVDNQISLADIDEDDIPWEHTIFIHHAYEASDYNADKRRLNQQYGFSKLSQRTNSDSSSTLSSTRINYTQLKKSNSPIVPYVERCKQLINDKYNVYRQSIKVYNPTDCAIRYAFFGNVWTDSVSSTLESLKTEFPGDITVSYRDLSDWRLSGIDVRFVMNQPLNDNPAVDEAFDVDKVAKRIARHNEFDNGHVLHNYKRMTSAEAEEKARLASIEDPDGIYYVSYDNIMNPSSDIKWKNGQQLTEDYEPLNKGEWFVGDSETGRIYYNEKDAQAAFDNLKKSGIANPVKMKVTDMCEDVNDGWVKRWNFLDKYYKDDLVISKISSPTNAWHLERVAPNGHTIEHLGNYSSLEAAKASCTKKNESKPIMEELWDRARVIDLVNYYLDRSNVPLNTLAKLVMKQMKKEGSKLPSNITDFYDSLHSAIDMYNEQFDESLHSKVIKESISETEIASVLNDARDNATDFGITDEFTNEYYIGQSVSAFGYPLEKLFIFLPDHISEEDKEYQDAVKGWKENEQIYESKSIKESSHNEDWYTKYYNIVEPSEVAEVNGIDEEELEYCEGHKQFLIAKDDYYDILSNSSYDTIELADVGYGDILAFNTDGRTYDVTNEIKEILSNGSVDDDLDESIKEDIDSNLEAVANSLFDLLKDYGAISVDKDVDVTRISFRNSEDDSDATLVHHCILSKGYKELNQYGNNPNVTEYMNEAGDTCVKLLIYDDSISVEVSKEDASQYNESLKENIGVGNLVTHVDDASGTRGIVVELNDDIAKVCVGDPANNDYVEVPLDKLQLDESLKEGVEKYIIGATERGLNLYYNAKEDHMSTDMKAATQYEERAVAADDYKAVKERYPTAYIRSTYDLPLLNKPTTKVKKRENEV